MRIDTSDLNMLFKQLSSEFFYYKNKRIFLTGGTGFFGKWLLEAFSFFNSNYDLNVQVTILSRSPEKFRIDFPHLYNENSFSFISGDIKSFDIPNARFDLIIHAATDASAELNRKNPKLMYSTIMDGAKRICEFAKDVKCKRILYTSSGAAYGPQPNNMERMAEDFTQNPNFDKNDAYASAKLESEKYFKENASCEIVIARCFAFSGPHLPLDGSYAFGNFISDALNQSDIVIKGSGEDIRSYLYAGDLIVWLLKILSTGEDRQIYNVGSPEAVTIKSLAEYISQGNLDVNILGDTNKNSRYIPCVRKAQEQLGLKIYTSLEVSIEKTLKYYM